MNPLKSIHEFKRDHVVHYWIRVLMFAFSIVFVALWLNDPGALADIEVFDINDGTEDLSFTTGDDPGIGICPSNRWYFPFMDEDGDFNVNWTDDNGTSWDGVVVQSEGWKGETKMTIQSIQCWVNNTTCILVRAEGADNAHDAYLFYLWGENDASDPSSWNYTSIYGGSLKADHFSMSFNRSGILWIVSGYNNAIWEAQWDVSTGDILVPDGGFTMWLSTPGYPMVQVDHNDDVWYAWFTTTDLWVYHQSGSPNMEMTISAGREKYSQFFITADNNKVFTGHYLYLATHQFAVAYETVVNTTLTKNLFQSDVDDWSDSYYSTGNCYGNVVSVIQLRTEPGSEEFVRYRAQYDAIDATWEASETVLWTVPTDTDICYHYSTGPNGVWPKIDGVSVSRLLSGDIHYWNFKDEKGAPDDYYDIVYTDNPVFTYWDWSAPEEPDPDPDPNGGSETPSYGFDVCDSNLMIAVVIFLIFFTLIGVFLQNAL